MNSAYDVNMAALLSNSRLRQKLEKVSFEEASKDFNCFIAKCGDYALAKKNFPYDDIICDTPTKKELISPNDIIWELINGKHKIEIKDVEKAVKYLEDAKQQNNSLYWILYKLVNKE